ncbi:MAG: SLC26A/SulP transporter family protein [Burkholderiales bacterium]|nr:SLC26A/SulP transporter family protein [Burkholderiales bacterium]
MTTAPQRFGYGLPDQAPAAPASSPAASRHPLLQQLRGDVVGGFTAAMLTIPVSMGYGILALSALGPTMLSHGILAGLYAPAIGCIVAVLLGANTTMIYSPRSIVTFLIGSIVLSSLVQSQLPFLRSATPDTMLAIVFLLILLAGLIQALFGVLRLGTLVKYVPAPVIAGFANAAAILIFLSQLDSLFGFRDHVPAFLIPFNLDKVQWPNLVVGVITCALILKGARITKAVPPTIIGMAGGVVAYYLMMLAGLRDNLGPVVGAIPFAWPSPHYFADFVTLVADPAFWPVVPVLLSGAVSLALIASLDGMLCARLVEADSGNRVQSNRELVRLGVGNMMAAGFGGIANGINLGSSFANHRSGARTPTSLLVHSAVILLGILVLAPLIAYLPRVVMAAMLFCVAVQLVDRWTITTCRQLLKAQFASPQSVTLDLLVIFAVLVAAVAVNVVVAVGVGLAVTILFFLARMSKSVIRRSYRCDIVHSRRRRETDQMRLLATQGAKILVFELEGPLFFGTAEDLAASVEAALGGSTSHVVIDFKRVNEIDSTGARVMLQLHERLKKDKIVLLLSSLEQGSRLAVFLADMGVTKAVTRSRMFQDPDRAIEWAEDQLLQVLDSEPAQDAQIPLDQFGVLANLDANEVATLEQALELRTYTKGEAVFREDDTSRDLYLIARGSASVHLRLPGTERETRLMTFSPGTVFGELALLDNAARSATVEADGDLVCYVLPHSVFEALAQSDPTVAMKVLAGIGRELAYRLRYASRTIYQLAS